MYCPQEFRSVLTDTAKLHGLDAGLLDALIQHESAWKLNAVGDNGLAIGLGQMHPTACQTIGADPATRGRDIPTDISLAASYLRWCIDRFYEHPVDTIRFGLMAYNQGPTVILRGLDYSMAVYELEGGAPS